MLILVAISGRLALYLVIYLFILKDKEGEVNIGERGSVCDGEDLKKGR